MHPLLRDRDMHQYPADEHTARREVTPLCSEDARLARAVRELSSTSLSSAPPALTVSSSSLTLARLFRDDLLVDDGVDGFMSCVEPRRVANRRKISARNLSSTHPQDLGTPSLLTFHGFS